MRRRWRIWLPPLVLLFGGAAFFHPAIYWPVTGRLRGESFYQGWPTSYWRNEIRKWEQPSISIFGSVSFRRRPTFREELSTRFGLSAPSPDTSPRPLQQGDPAAIPVLIELLRDEDSDVGIWAIFALGNIGSEAKSVGPLLLEEVLRRDGELAGWHAIHALLRIDPEILEGEINRAE